MMARTRSIAIRPIRRLASTLALALLAPWIAGTAFAQATGDSDAVLGRFIQYVRWPDEATAQHPWRLCVAGDAAAATQYFQGTLARNRQILVVAPDSPADVAHCHLLDLRQIDPAALPAWLDAARDKPVLTLGHDASFCTRGGHICFRQEPLHGFDINLSAAQATGLRISARLLASEPDDTP